MNTVSFHSAFSKAPAHDKSYYGDVSAGLNHVEKCEMAMAKLFVPDLNTGGIPAFKGFAEAYVYLTGDSDISGCFKPDKTSKDLRSCQEFSSQTFSHALQNAMNMFLTKAYRDFPMHEEILISQKNKVTDFRKIRSIQLGYFGELPDIDPETADYADMAPYGDSEAEYALSQKGAIVWVTRRHIINDSINVIQGMTQRLARAARLAHAKYVWQFFINNALCPDGTPWFTSEHGNLADAALDIAPLVTGIKALANMTEPGHSEEKVGLDLETFDWRLVVPINMWDIAVKKNQCDSVFSEDNLTTKDPNPCLKLFGERNERIVTCPFLTAANDWGIIRNREDVPIVEMSYLNGQEEPIAIPEWGPASEGMFIFKNDRLGYKIRFEFGGALADYRGGYRSIIT
ncbi:MAG: hypothetical protein BWY69_00810 [Planctomycetes bacterium ADurb.Bin401]|jgi:hypothetical protein|nr:MAG: hypothetical protein BWY69_00810 [Planctomycetes bacterium ADurb.Bin401]HPD57938.1 hypothetical protein [Smithellaceae bacterium]